MDNFFQILFILFIIFSFLAPMFKKKKTEDEQKMKRQRPDDNSRSAEMKPTYSSSSRSPDKDYDILKEIEGMFNSTSETKPVEESKTNNEVMEDYDDSSEWHEPSKTENTINDEWHRPTTLADYAKEEKIMDEKAKAFEKLLNKEEKVNIISKKIRASIKNPETLKEYFVISEILGQPRGFELY